MFFFFGCVPTSCDDMLGIESTELDSACAPGGVMERIARYMVESQIGLPDRSAPSLNGPQPSPANETQWQVREGRSRALDIAPGSVLATAILASKFSEVVAVHQSKPAVEYATRLSKQLEDTDKTFAGRTQGIVRAVGEASSFLLPRNTEWRGTVSLVTVGQGLHWFDVDKFVRHVDNYLAPGGVLAVWTYNAPRLKPQAAHDALHGLDKKLAEKGYTPRCRQHVVDGYKQLKQQVEGDSFRCVEESTFETVREVTADSVADGASKWFGVLKYVETTGDTTLVPKLREQLVAAAGEKGTLESATPFTLLIFIKRTTKAGAKL